MRPSDEGACVGLVMVKVCVHDDDATGQRVCVIGVWVSGS
jgi:hypothetical protein